MSHHILIVEDDESVLQFLAMHMGNQGYRVTTLTHGGEILDTIANDPTDLILLDLGLPDGDGLTRIMEIRKQSSVPIIVLTGREGDGDRLMALGMGSDDYISKPCNPRELSLRVRNVLARSIDGEMPKDMRGDDQASADRRKDSTSWPSTDSVKDKKPASSISLKAAVLFLAVLSFGSWAVYWFSDTPFDNTQPIISAEKNNVSTSEESIIQSEEILQLSPAEILGFGWINDVQCGVLPDVSWWKYNSYEKIYGYVMNRHNGNWDEYLKYWVNRWATMQDIYNRDSRAITPDGDYIQGEALLKYVNDLKARVKVIGCLSKASAEHQSAKP